MKLDIENPLFEHLPLGRLMSTITKKYYGALSKQLEHLGVDRHFSPLVVIDKTKEKCTQQYLSDLLNIDKVAMVRILDYLVDKGMITRVVNPNDRREHIVQLTAKAKKVMLGIHKGIIDMNKTALKGLNKGEQEQLHKYMSTIIGNIENLPVNKVDIKLKKK
jgi:MarR family transcriptional regulator for hemolysin